MKPTFLFIGPDKTGSTWLYEVLRQHPRCFVPTIKDLYFFDRHYHRGLEWYATFFREAPHDALAVGELSHDYLFSTLAADRIFRDLPGVKLLTSLRNPAERSFSQYLYFVRSGLTRSSFEDACVEFPEIIDNSLYHKHLGYYLERFGEHNVRVLLFEDLVADPRTFAMQVFGYLGLPPADGIDYQRRVLPASRPRNHFAARLAKLGANAARRLGTPAIVGMVKRGVATRLLYRPFSGEERPRLTDDDRARLMERFRDDVERLQTAIGRDLSPWLSARPVSIPRSQAEIDRLSQALGGNP